jgi:putative ABC transport system permease protein
VIALGSWIGRRARALFNRGAVEADMHAELALHFDLRVRELEKAGLSPLEARRRAVAEFGGMEHVRESYRDARGVVTLETTMQDIRYALRTLWRQRTFTATAVLTFAAGVGAATAIYSLVDTAWFGWTRMFPDADRVAMVYKTFPQGRGAVSPADYRDWRDQSRSFSDLAAYTRTQTTVIAGGEPARFRAVAATPNYFAVVGVHPLLGRFFQDGETQWGNNNVVVLSHGTWKKSFAGDPAVIGRQITLDGKTAQIIGVAPPGAWFARGAPEVYVPLSFAPNDPTNDRHSHFLFSLGRLAPGRTISQANAELLVIAGRIAAVNPENQGTRAVVVPVSEVVLGDVKPMMKLLLAAAALLLVIAAANVTNLQLARTTSRVRELAVRLVGS